jgi:hypothetical protein
MDSMSRHQITAFVIRLLGIALLIYGVLPRIPTDQILDGAGLAHCVNIFGRLIYPVPYIYPLSQSALGLILVFAAVPLSKLLWAGIADHHE